MVGIAMDYVSDFYCLDFDSTVEKWDFHRIALTHDCHLLHHLGFAVVTGLRYPSRVATQMLTEIYDEFSKTLGQKAASAAPNSMSKSSKPLLSKYCQKYGDVRSVDKASALMDKVDIVKGQMQDNIAAMLQNMEKTEAISTQADQLNEQASVFKKKSTDLRRQMKWKNMKMTAIIVLLITGILLVILIPLLKKAKKSEE
jgi:vesicle-associated membrane protein 7